MFRKLHNQRGASILVALMFFLICAMVSAVILGSATTNAQKLQHQKEQAQVYYSVSSAAKLLRDTVNQLSMDGKEHFTTYSCWGIENADQYTFSPAREQNGGGYDGVTIYRGGAEQDKNSDALLALLETGVEQVYRSKLLYAQDDKKPFTGWTGQFSLEDGHYTVDAEVTIESDYSLTFRLQPHDEQWKDDYSMVVSCAGRSSDPAQSTQTQPNGSHELTYKDYNAGESKTETRECTASITTYTTTISWEPGMIYKGAVSNE